MLGNATDAGVKYPQGVSTCVGFTPLGGANLPTQVSAAKTRWRLKMTMEHQTARTAYPIDGRVVALLSNAHAVLQQKTHTGRWKAIVSVADGHHKVGDLLILDKSDFVVAYDPREDEEDREPL